MEGDDRGVTDLGFVSGDLVYIISNCQQSDNTVADPKSKCVMACSSGRQAVISSDVAKMETETVDEVNVNENGDGDLKMESCVTVPSVSNAELNVNGLHAENSNDFADNSREKVSEADSTGVLCTMSTEDLQLVNRYLNEPMVVREATDHTLPQTLVLAYSVVRPQTADAALLVVIDILMSELGYQRTAVCSDKLQIIIKQVNV